MTDLAKLLLLDYLGVNDNPPMPGFLRWIANRISDHYGEGEVEVDFVQALRRDASRIETLIDLLRAD